MRKKLIPILASLLVIVGCSDGTAPEVPSMAGSWSGNFRGATVTFTATEDNRNIVGNGHISAGVESIALTISGTHVHPDVALTLTAIGFQEMAFSGMFSSDTQITGRLNGSGFNNEQVVLIRQ